MYMIGFYGRPIGSDGASRWIYTHINNNPEQFAGRDAPDDDPAIDEIYSRYEHISGFTSVSHARFERLDGLPKVSDEPLFVVDDAGSGRAWVPGEDVIRPKDRIVLWPCQSVVLVIVRSYLPGSSIDDDREAVTLALDYLFEQRAKNPALDRMCGTPGVPGYSLPAVRLV